MEDRLQKMHILNGLYLAQECLWKKCSPPFEVLLLNYNYQDIRIVTTKIVEVDGQKIIIQTSGCDCGPQPCIRAGLVKDAIHWEDSKIKKALESGKIKILKRDLCDKLARQTMVPTVFLVAPPETEEERELYERGLEMGCPGKKVRSF